LSFVSCHLRVVLGEALRRMTNDKRLMKKVGETNNM